MLEVMMEEVDREMQTRNLSALAKSPDGFKFTKTFFPYTSGEIGSYYVQSAGIMADGKAYAQACDDMAALVKKALGPAYGGLTISGGESRDWIFSGPVAQILQIPHLMIYKDGKTIGASVKDMPVVHVADLNNEGSSPRDLWMPAVRKAGGLPGHIFFFVDRMEDGVKVMRDIELQSHAVIPLDTYAWDFLRRESVITSEIYKALRERLEDKQAWAETMLKSEEGLETLAALLGSGKTREKGQKILAVGYPKIKEEVADRLRTKFGRGIERWL